MEEARVQYDADAEEQQHYNYVCCTPSTSSTSLAPCLQLQKSCHSCSHDSSTDSTPFVSAPSSPFTYYSAQATLAASQALDAIEYAAYGATTDTASPSSPSLSEFEFNSRFSEADAWFNTSSVSPPMSTAEELFHNGRIRPLNTALCSSPYCICFSNAAFDDDYQDPHFEAYNEKFHASPAHAEPHQQHQHPVTLKQRLKHAKPTSTSSALEQWKRSVGRYDKGHSRPAHGQQHAEKVMPLSSLPLACYNRNSRRAGGHHRRARSLSPMRVFHMDEKMMQTRASFESEILHTDTKTLHTDTEGAGSGPITRPRRSRKSWTLKELLNMGDNRVHDRRPQRRRHGVDSAKLKSMSAFKRRMEEIEASSTESSKENAGTRALKEERLDSKSGTRNHEGTRSPWNLQQDEREHADQYSCSTIESEEGTRVEEIGKRNFVRYKKGLLACLGFTTSNGTKLNQRAGMCAIFSPSPTLK